MKREKNITLKNTIIIGSPIKKFYQNTKKCMIKF